MVFSIENTSWFAMKTDGTIIENLLLERIYHPMGGNWSASFSFVLPEENTEGELDITYGTYGSAGGDVWTQNVETWNNRLIFKEGDAIGILNSDIVNFQYMGIVRKVTSDGKWGYVVVSGPKITSPYSIKFQIIDKSAKVALQENIMTSMLANDSDYAKIKELVLAESVIGSLPDEEIDGIKLQPGQVYDPDNKISISTKNWVLQNKDIVNEIIKAKEIVAMSPMGAVIIPTDQKPDDLDYFNSNAISVDSHYIECPLPDVMPNLYSTKIKALEWTPTTLIIWL